MAGKAAQGARVNAAPLAADAHARNGALGALMREASTTPAERRAVGRKGQQGLRKRFEQELDPRGTLRARDPGRLEELITRRVRLHCQEIGKLSGAARRKPAATPTTRAAAPADGAMAVVLYDCRDCAQEQGRPTVPGAIVRPCEAHLLAMAESDEPVREALHWVRRFCDVLLLEQRRDRDELTTLRAQLRSQHEQLATAS